MGLDLLLHANWPSYGEASLQSVDLSLKVSEGVMSPGTRSWSRTESAGITPTQLQVKTTTRTILYNTVSGNWRETFIFWFKSMKVFFVKFCRRKILWTSNPRKLQTKFAFATNFLAV